MSSENPCPKIPSKENIEPKSIVNTTRCSEEQTLNKKGNDKNQKECQIDLVPISTAQEISENDEHVIAYSSTDISDKKMFYITNKASLTRKCKPTPDISCNEANYREDEIDKNKENCIEKRFTDAVIQKIVVTANSDFDLVGDDANHITIESKHNEWQVQNNQRGNEERTEDNNEDKDKIIENDADEIATENNTTVNKDDDDDDDCVIFPGAQKILKKVHKISEELFKDDSFSEFDEPQEIKYSNDNDNTSAENEEKETKEPAPEFSRTIFETVKSKVFSIFVKKSSVSENNVTYNVETDIIGSVHARNIEASASLYQTMRKTVTSIFTFGKEEEAEIPPELQLGSGSSSRSYLQDIFFDDGFTSN